MSKKSSNIGTEVSLDRDLITDDDSSLMTDESSLISNELSKSSKDNITIDDDEIKDRDDDSQESTNSESENKERFFYVKMEIDEPPTFFESQYMIPDSSIKKSAIESDDDDDDDDDKKNRDIVIIESDNEDDEVFEKKKNPSKGSGLKDFLFKKLPTEKSDEPGPSSRSKSNRKSRKSRKDDNKKDNSVSELEKGDKKMSGLSNWVKKVLKKEETEESSGGFNFSKRFNKYNSNSVKENFDNRFSNYDNCKRDIDSIDTKVIEKKIIKHLTVAKDEKQHHVLTIAGVKVDLPVNPYPSQIAVMNKLIQGCKKKEHCLLESPTGSGKTLALLCGVLAWQDHMQDEVRQNNLKTISKSRELFEKDCRFAEDDNNKGGSEISNPSSSTELKAADQSFETFNNCCKNVDESFDKEISQPYKKICRSTSPNNETEILNDNKTTFESVIDDFKDRKVPKIYYGSRTHKQIEQVIRELNKTVYSSKRMTILSSREFTCLHNTNQNKTELCNQLLEPKNERGGCNYYNDNSKNKISSHSALQNYGICGSWDIEDLVNIGRQESACPYFAARELMADAEIIFCPYNYLIDPNIRDSMQIQLSGQVIILDEAHNIEEMSREVGSLYFREDNIKAVIEEAELLRTLRKDDYDTYDSIAVYLKTFIQFIKLNPLNNVDKFSDTRSSDFWTGNQLWELFKINSLGKGYSKNFEKASGAAIMDFNTAKEEINKNRDNSTNKVISTITKRFLEDIVLAIATILPSEKLSNDYRACIVEETVRISQGTSSSGGNNWDIKKLRTLKMLCMNPAVIFSQLANSARTIVLASGTLSPIHSFQSELGTVFPHKLDANHVVPKENVYIRGVASGPTGVQLKANFANVNSWNFQDELGRLVLNVCSVIPHGVLCFFSSYNVMQKQIDRWKENSCWYDIQKFKYILQEPRGSSNLEPVMQQFRDIIQDTSNKSDNQITGALLLAVFRGKVAEGIDFSDNEARCVMAIGIPYAVRMDPSVDMKFTYNNLNQPKGLLKGGEWYAVQAFRALNQALGRCLRHRNDWGAVLLVDQRFLERSNFNYLPKWVKSMWRSTVHYNLGQELKEFVERQIEREKKDVSNSSEPKISDT